MTKRGKDQGYTLVEMIVVIAIIAVVAGMSLISVTLIHSAKAKNASTTVDSEIATLITRSRNMQSDREGCQYAARIYADDKGAYYFQRGYYDIKNKKYDFTNTDPEGEGKGVSLSSYVVVRYIGVETRVDSSLTESESGEQTPDIHAEGVTFTDSSVKEEGFEISKFNGGQGLFIRFAKDGTCEEGVGDIRFYKRNGNIVAHEYIRANGSHQCK